MDSHGVPHKINRHVFKAVNFLGDCSNFPNIYDYVKTCTKNLRPVPQLKETIRKSLNNLKSVGIIKMDARNQYYKLKTKFPINTESDDDNNNNNNNIGEGSSYLSKQSRKRHQIHSDNDEEEYNEEEYDEIENVSKRFKPSSKKNIPRARVQSKKLPKHRRYNLRQKNSSKAKQPETSSSSKANVIFKKIDDVTSDGYGKDELNTNDKEKNNSDCENRQSKEIYDLRTDEDEKTNDNENDNDVLRTKSVSSKKTSSHLSGDFEEIHEPEEQLAGVMNNESSNINNECQIVDDTLGIIRRYNYNYLN